MTDAKLLFGYNDKGFNEPKESLNKIKQKYTDKILMLWVIVSVQKLLKH